LVINQSSTARLDGQTPAAIRAAMRKGNSVTLGGMNCRISEVRLRGVCRELLRAGRPVSHRALRQILRERFGAAGKTARVLKIWREESARVAAAKQTNDPPRQLPALPVDIQQIQERLKQAEAHAAEQRVRAEVAELREQSHQDRWALEIDRLREQLRAQPNYAREVRGLQSTVTRLTAELAALRGALAGTSVGEQGPTPGAV
jgi:Plasmid replication region DNA-binding N-term